MKRIMIALCCILAPAVSGRMAFARDNGGNQAESRIAQHECKVGQYRSLFARHEVSAPHPRESGCA